MPDPTDPAGSGPWWRWLVLTLAVAGATVVGWVCVTEWGGVLHGHPAYPLLLSLTLLVSAATAWRARRALPLPHGWRGAAHVVVLVVGSPGSWASRGCGRSPRSSPHWRR